MAVWKKRQKIAKCKVEKCPHDEFSCGDGGLTTTLWRHLESAHWTQYVMTEEYKKKKKVRSEGGDVIDNSKNPSATILTNVNNIKLYDMFAGWIINRQYPFTIIEDLS
ncbi:10474_t:CDS:2 [Dentiscutata heterogama]|uniref:10474_t:CDS:1 n=1 Tax=Dentiscutata heterogama TaxID=1316150 RepID=A0ACA9L4J1_9GLOM|nr:10474_t:CDS:2 [Dentiscutata heterogama]